jgi:hypothetical protein
VKLRARIIIRVVPPPCDLESSELRSVLAGTIGAARDAHATQADR